MAGATKLMTAGGGGVNLQPASSIASDVTVTLPTVAQKLIGDKTPGTVLQVVNATISGDVGTTSGSFVSTGLNASITPSSATSKILVIVASNISFVQVNQQALWWAIYRGTSGAGSGSLVGANSVYVYAPQASWYQPSGYTLLDSPATTSTLTYTVMHRAGNAGNNCGFCYGLNSGNLGTITLMEIAA